MSCSTQTATDSSSLPKENTSIQIIPEKVDIIKEIGKFLGKNDKYIIVNKPLNLEIKSVDNKMLYIISIEGHKKINRIQLEKSDFFKFIRFYNTKYGNRVINFQFTEETKKFLCTVDRIVDTTPSNKQRVIPFCLIEELRIFHRMNVVSVYLIGYKYIEGYDKLQFQYEEYIELKKFSERIVLNSPTGTEITKRYLKSEEIIKELCSKYGIKYVNHCDYAFERKTNTVKIHSLCYKFLIAMSIFAFVLIFIAYNANDNHKNALQEIKNLKTQIESQNLNIGVLNSEFNEYKSSHLCENTDIECLKKHVKKVGQSKSLMDELRNNKILSFVLMILTLYGAFVITIIICAALSG